MVCDVDDLISAREFLKINISKINESNLFFSTLCSSLKSLSYLLRSFSPFLHFSQCFLCWNRPSSSSTTTLPPLYFSLYNPLSIFSSSDYLSLWLSVCPSLRPSVCLSVCLYFTLFFQFICRILTLHINISLSIPNSVYHYSSLPLTCSNVRAIELESSRSSCVLSVFRTYRRHDILNKKNNMPNRKKKKERKKH